MQLAPLSVSSWLFVRITSDVFQVSYAGSES
jgi:hypothetical protein